MVIFHVLLSYTNMKTFSSISYEMDGQILAANLSFHKSYCNMLSIKSNGRMWLFLILCPLGQCFVICPRTLCCDLSSRALQSNLRLLTGVPKKTVFGTQKNSPSTHNPVHIKIMGHMYL